VVSVFDCPVFIVFFIRRSTVCVHSPHLRCTQVKNFSQADPEYGGRIAELLKKYKSVRTVLCDMPRDP